MKINSKLILIFVAISALIITIAAITFILEGEDSLSKRIEAQLESVVVLKENQINRFIDEGIDDIEEIAELDLIRDYMSEFHNDSGEYIYGIIEEEREEEILGVLNEKLNHTLFFEIFIISMVGKVDISTEPANKGRVWEKENYFIRGKKETHVQNFYYDITLKEPAITISTPIISKEGDTVGVVVGRVRTQEISSLMLERSGLGETGETYLVNKFNFVVSELQKEEGAVLKRTIYTNTVKECLNGNQGFGYYKDYASEEVVGFYKWIPEREVCLLAEIGLEEAFAPINELKFIVVLMGIVLVILTMVIGTFLARSLSKPIINLRDAAIRIGKGKLDTEIKVRTKDEIGDLANAFNQMTKDLKKSRKKLEEYSRTLEKKVKERTKELEESKKELEKTNYDLERFNKLAVGRELRMIELKKKIKELESGQGKGK